MTDILVHSGDNLATKIASAVTGDNVIIDAGATFDRSTSLVLHNHGSGSTPITIKSSALASLPSGRVAPADASNMPRIRTTSAQSLIANVAGGSYWILDGLELTDNASVDVAVALFDLRGGGKVKMDHCYAHPKETNPDWTRALSRAIWYGGSAGLNLQNSYFKGWLGYDLAGSALQLTQIINSDSGKNVTVHNCFLNAHYGAFFTGGEGKGVGDVTATLSGTPTTTGAIFSSTTGLTVGQYVRVDFRGTLTKSGSTFTRTAGDALVQADIPGTGSYASLGYGLGTLIIGTGYTFNLRTITSDVWTFNETSLAGGLADGTYQFEVYQCVVIDSINTGTGAVTYHAIGNEGLTRAPSAAFTRMSWVTGDGNNAADWTITGNTFWRDPEFVAYLIGIGEANYMSKGIVEMKHIKRLLVEGNYFTGHPNSWFLRQYNQDGSEPWSTVSDVTIRNNYFAPDEGLTAVGGHPVSVNLGDPYRSSQPGKNVVVENNLVVGYSGLVQGQFGSNVEFRHNTIINKDNNTIGTYASIMTYDGEITSGFVMRDNIMDQRTYAYQCLVDPGTIGTCWPGATWAKNLILDIPGTNYINDTYFGAGGYLAPAPTSFAAVGFVDLAGGNYRLAPTSAYKGAGTSGSDPGINQDALEAALGFTISGGGSGPTVGDTMIFNKFNSFVEAIAEKVHNLGTDTLTAFLTTNANTPVATNSQLSHITPISYANLSSRVIAAPVSSLQTAGVYKLILTDLVLTASGVVATFRMIGIYNETATNDELICWFDWGLDVALKSGDSLTLDFDGTNGLIEITATGGGGGGSSTLTTGLVASWKLADLTDATGRGNTLTNNNGVTFTAGKLGNAGTFVHASDQFLSKSSSADVQFGPQDWTIGLWLKFPSIPEVMALICKDDAGTSGAREITLGVNSDQNIYCYLFNATDAAVLTERPTGLEVDIWYCAIVAHNATAHTLTIYIDNDAGAGGSVGTLQAAAGAPFLLGGFGTTGTANDWNGQIDNVNIWHKVLTSGERTEFFNSGTGKEHPFT